MLSHVRLACKPPRRRHATALAAATAALVAFPAIAQADTVVQGEALSLNPVSAGDMFNETAALGGTTMRIWSNASIRGSVNMAEPSVRLVLRARGTSCKGAPKLSVSVDGVTRMQSDVSSSSYADYSTSLSLAKGTHSVEVIYANDFHNRRCDRNVYVDEVKFVAGTASAPEPAPAPAPTTSERQTSWRAPMSPPLADATAASRVIPARETRFTNQDENSYRPSAAELDAYRNGERDNYGRTAAEYSPLANYVTGDFSGTTDEIIQWAAHKWGIPEDTIRAQAVTESYWNMSALGDRTTVSNPLNYPSLSRIAGTSDVYQSLGIMQVRWSGPDGAGTGAGTEPLRWKSTAFNIDFYASTVRYYYDGRCYWCSGSAQEPYAAGQEWLSVGGWFNPYPWGNDGQKGYIAKVQGNLNNRTWEQTGFSE